MNVNKKLSSLKHSASKRGLSVDINIDHYKELLELGCNYCGVEVKNAGGYSLDRIDNTKGYTMENIVPCCKICNVAKNNMSIPQFISWIQRIHTKVNNDIKYVEQLLAENFDVNKATRELIKNRKVNTFRWLRSNRNNS